MNTNWLIYAYWLDKKMDKILDKIYNHIYSKKIVSNVSIFNWCFTLDKKKLLVRDLDLSCKVRVIKHDFDQSNFPISNYSYSRLPWIWKQTSEYIIQFINKYS